MSFVVIRTIHPIGQGAFYSERFELDNQVIANIVYDCGTSTKPKKKAENYVSVNDMDKIDILFISHFDSDHVCLLETLMNSVSEIGCVVLPALPSGIYKQILGYIITDKISLSLINNPDIFFQNKCKKIIYVDRNDPFNDSELQKTDQVSSGEVTDVDRIQSGTHIQNGLSISISKLHSIWKFKSYHIFDYGLVDKFLKVYKSELDEFTKNKNASRKLIKKLRDGFKKYYKNLNDYSLLMYSGPVETSELTSVSFSSCGGNRFIHCHSKLLAGCLYTGDANFDMKRFDIINYSKTILGMDIVQIGLVQIPHHGSATSYTPGILTAFPAIDYFLSCGTKNNYCHPSYKVVSSVMGLANNLMIITEEKNTKVEQKIEI